MPSVDETNGNILIPALTPAGVYTIEYEICIDEAPNTCDQATITITVVEPIADISILKTVDNPTPEVGSTIVFTITVTNFGSEDIQDIEVTEQLPSGFNYVSDNGSGAYSSSTGIWEIASLEGGNSTSLEITVSVNEVGDFVNFVSYEAYIDDPFDGNDTSSIEVFPQYPPIDVTVNCPLTEFDLSTVNILNVPPGATVTYHSSEPPTSGNIITPVVNSSGTYIIAFYDSNDDCYSGANAVNVTIVDCEVDLEVVKTVSDPTPFVGDNIVFTIAVNNLGPDNATGVQVVDILPSGYTYVSDNSGGSYDPATSLWEIGDLLSSESEVLQITATVNATGNYLNTAEVSGNEDDPDLNNNESSVNTSPVNVLVAIDDSFNCANGNSGQTQVLNVLDNDSLNGNLINPSDVTVTLVTGDSELELQSNGNVDVVAGTQEGIYNLTYEICEVSNPSNCSQADVEVSVSPFIVFEESTDLSDCGADDGTIEFSGLIPAQSYTLTVNTTSQSITPTSSNFIIEDLPDGNYSITVENADNCLSNELVNIEIVEPGPPPAPSGIGCD